MKKYIFNIIVLSGLIFSGFFVYAEDIIPPADPAPVVDPVSTPDPVPVLVENILIRNGGTVLYNGTFNLPAEGTIAIVDSNNVSHDVNSRSVLGVLYALDQESDSFSISNLQYYDSFSSLYLKCLVSSSAEELCDNWQYVVGGTSPWTSIDATILSGGESIGLYFGSPYRVNLDVNSIVLGQSINATAQAYSYLDDTWNVRTGVTIGATQPNPNDPWNPTVVATYPTDEAGKAIINLTIVGDYNIGISEDYYFPSYPVVVNSEPISSSGTGDPVVVPTFSISNAISFLSSNQKIDGSFGSTLYTDWAAIAASSANNNSLKNSISNYFKSNDFSSSIVTDNERHAMALMSLGINPYTGTGINYIDKIVKSFDGNQIGDRNLVNDDIFGLVVLSKAGYRIKDIEISNTLDFVKSKQLNDGSWEGSPDLTSAAIDALSVYKSKDGIEEVLNKAYAYLRLSTMSDGSVNNNTFSTSWASQVFSLNSSFLDLKIKSNEYLASQQNPDGSVGLHGEDLNSMIWATSYAIPAAAGLSWSQILESFDKEINIEDNKKSNPEPVEEVIKEEIKKEEIKVPENIIIKKEEIVSEKKEITTPILKTKKITNIENNKKPELSQEKTKNLSASASDSVFAKKIPEITKIVWSNIKSFLKGIWSYF